MNGVILYRTTYGATEQYARWLSEETGFPAMPLREVKKNQLRSVGCVIIGCPIHAGRPTAAGWIRKHWPLLADRPVILFTTSGAPPELPALKEGFATSLPEHIRSRIEYYPLGGRMIMSELKPVHRLLMRIGQMVEKDPDAKAGMVLDIDNVDRSSIAPILDHIRSLEQSSNEHV